MERPLPKNQVYTKTCHYTGIVYDETNTKESGIYQDVSLHRYRLWRDHYQRIRCIPRRVTTQVSSMERHLPKTQEYTKKCHYKGIAYGETSTKESGVYQDVSLHRYRLWRDLYQRIRSIPRRVTTQVSSMTRLIPKNQEYTKKCHYTGIVYDETLPKNQEYTKMCHYTGIVYGETSTKESGVYQEVSLHRYRL